MLTWLGIGFICAGLLFILAIAVNFESAVETTITESVEATEDESGFVSVFALLGSAFGLIAAAIFIGGGAIVIGGVLLIVALIVKNRAS